MAIRPRFRAEDASTASTGRPLRTCCRIKKSGVHDDAGSGVQTSIALPSSCCSSRWLGVRALVVPRCKAPSRAPPSACSNVGEEAIKGNEVVKQAAELLRASGLNFYGNVEGNDIYRGTTGRGSVCDGFVGKRPRLKASEGLAQMLAGFRAGGVHAQPAGRA